MQSKWRNILIWVGAIAVLTPVAMGVWFVLCGGSQTTSSLKMLQLLQTTGTFLLPPLLCACLWDERHRPFHWLHMDRSADGKVYLFAIAIMICAIPAINLLADLNSRIQLPAWLSPVETYLRSMEDQAAALTERFLQAENIGQLLLNIGLMALLPAMAEEMTFRGTLQQILGGYGGRVTGYGGHVAIWLTALIFSAIHMQFYGFIPRMLMGALFGYMFVWTGSLWVPIIMHFTNNGLAVMAYYLIDEGGDLKNYADTLGAGTTWWIGVTSLVITSLGLLIFYRRTHTQ